MMSYIRLCAVGLMFVIFSPVFAQQNLFKIFHKTNPDGSVDIYARNRNFCPYEIKVDFSELKGLEASVKLPYYTKVTSGTEEHFLFKLVPEKDSTPKFFYKYTFYAANPVAVPDDYIYLLPFEHGKSFKVTQSYNGKYSHHGEKAIDFKLAEGESIFAARGGVVVKVKEDSNIGGADKKFINDGNFITIYHNDGTFADYYHLKENGAVVAQGDVVQAGQMIGYCGNTGFSNASHLHFQVYIAGYGWKKTLSTRFYNENNRVVENLKVGDYYKAIHPEKEIHPQLFSVQ